MGKNDYAGVERRVGGYQNMTGFRRRFDDFEGQSRIDRVKQTASRITGDVSDKAHELTHRAGEVADTAREKAGVVADRARERAGQLKAGAERGMRQLNRETHENPLRVAAGAAIAGLALGMLLPRTRKEDKVMGGARDEFVDRAGEAASRVRRQLAAFQVHQAQRAGDLRGQCPVELHDVRVHLERLAAAELDVARHVDLVARAQLAAEHHVRLQQHRSHARQPLEHARFLEQLQSRNLTVRVVDGVVEVAQGVQLVVPDLDPGPEGLAIGHRFSEPYSAVGRRMISR